MRAEDVQCYNTLPVNARTGLAIVARREREAAPDPCCKSARLETFARLSCILVLQAKPRIKKMYFD